MNTKRTIRCLIFGIFMLSVSAASFAQIGFGISVRFGPPPIPIYEQPVCPGPGYFWTPGYWAWSDDGGYYWVPGTWVIAPVGMYWTPGYWGWNDGVYAWYDGYWGPHVGFYGGINYGFGYTGEGFYGGEWRGRSFYYNREVMNVRNTRITNVYNRTVIINNNSHVAFNGGEGGISARPNRDQERFAHEHHVAAIAAQKQHMREASHNRALFARENNGRPSIAATARPGDFKTHVVAAREAGGAYHPPAISPREARVKPGENRQAQRNEPARKAGGNRNAEVNRNAENRNAARQATRENAKQQAQQQKAEQRNQQKQAEQQKAEQRNAGRQPAQQRKAEQQRADRQQGEQRKAEQRNQQRQAEQQRAQQQKAEQQRNDRQQAEQRKNEQKNAQRQQAQAQKQQQQAQKAEQRQAQQQRQAQPQQQKAQHEQKQAQQKPQPSRGVKPDKGPGR